VISGKKCGGDVGENCGGRWFLYCGGLFYTVGEVLGKVGVGRRGWG